jgi:hypothetical protein
MQPPPLPVDVVTSTWDYIVGTADIPAGLGGPGVKELVIPLADELRQIERARLDRYQQRLELGTEGGKVQVQVQVIITGTVRPCLYAGRSTTVLTTGTLKRPSK